MNFDIFRREKEMRSARDDRRGHAYFDVYACTHLCSGTRYKSMVSQARINT